MGRKSRLCGWIGLGCLVVLLILGLGRYHRLAVKLSPPARPVWSEAAPSDLLATGAVPAVAPECLVPKPDVSPERLPPAAAAPPDRAERQPVRIVRSESLQKLEALIKKYAALHGVDEDLVWAVIRHESGFNPCAVSPKGAMGLMQLMPGTAALLGVKDPFNVEQNIQGGIRYLEMCLARFDQDVSLALAAYNAGPGNVTKYQGCPPFPETQQYVAAVLQDYGGPPLRRGLRPRTPISPPEAVEPAKPSGLQWSLPIPVVKVSNPQWHLRQPRWQGVSLPRRLQALAAKSPTGSPRRAQPQ